MHSARVKRLKRHRIACRKVTGYPRVIKKWTSSITRRKKFSIKLFHCLAQPKRNQVSDFNEEDKSSNNHNQTSSLSAEPSLRPSDPIDVPKGQKEPSTLFRHLLDSLKNMDSSAQLDMWKNMIANHPFDLHQLKSLRTFIEERIRLDIISGVPYEIALYIMSFLSPKDLCQAAQTCRSWRTVCEDNRMWREKCKEAGLLDDELTLEALFRERIANTHIKQEKFLKETIPTLTKSEWKVAYLKHMSILRNWRTRNFELSKPFIEVPKSHVEVSKPAAFPKPSQTDHSQSQPNQVAPMPHNNSLINSRYDNSPAFSTRYNTRRAGLTLSGNGSLQRSQKNLDKTSGDEPNNVRQSNGSKVVTSSNHTTEYEAAFNRSYLMQLRCHEDSVITCLQYNPRTNTIVSGSDDQTLKVWSSETGRCITTLEGHSGGVWSSQLSPKDIVISGSTDRSLKVWNAHSGVLLHTLHGHTSTVRCLALDGNYVVSGSRDTTLRLWDIVEGNCMQLFVGHSAAVRCVEYKNGIIVSGAYDHLVMVWDARTGACYHSLESHTSRIYSLQFDGRTIASGSLDASICIWDATTGKLRHHLEGHTSLTSKMQLKGNLLVSANADSFCKVWDVNTGECLQTLGGENKHTSAITSVYFDERHVVTSSDDGTVKLWDIRNGKFIKDLVVLPTASKGGVVWRIRASYTKLICAVGSRTQTEDTHLLVLDFSA